jgi:anthranilate synthase/aminodeoxychorismate synthase-like glutamine amidotransferase
MKLLLLDNYDSFTYNLYQYLRELGAEVVVVRNDEIEVEEVSELGVSGVVLSPGPGSPADAGISLPLIRELGIELPILGVCLGLQAIGVAYGGRVVEAPELVHGKTSAVQHGGRGVFKGLPSPFQATRYHSLIVERASLPRSLEVTAETAEGLIMGLRHRELPVEGVQFHPESLVTEHGHALLKNFLDRLKEPEL